MSSSRQDWEDRYNGRADFDRHGDAAPSEFLAAHAHRLHGRVLDVAAGAGRNALFLARRGNAVEALDIAHAGLRQACAVARAAGLNLLAVQADLETFPLPRDRYDAAINVRYLQRSLFEPLQRAVKAGGIILFETFLIDQRTIGHPRNPAFLLERGELRTAFARCDVLEYAEGYFDTGTQSAYLARLLARRRRD